MEALSYADNCVHGRETTATRVDFRSPCQYTSEPEGTLLNLRSEVAQEGWWPFLILTLLVFHAEEMVAVCATLYGQRVVKPVCD